MKSDLSSLFILSLPRSFSTRTYHLSRNALGLAEPSWTRDGEILNLHLYAHLREEERGGAEGCTMTAPDRYPRRFAQLTEFLDQVTVRHGLAYKDVLQPILISQWLASQNLGVLIIQRPLADIAYAMLARNWIFPELRGSQNTDQAMINAIAMGQKAIDAAPGVKVRFDELIEDESVLWNALRTIYPDVHIPKLCYIDREFRAIRQEVLRRRSERRYQELEAICAGAIET
jgi:hypothetical protein